MVDFTWKTKLFTLCFDSFHPFCTSPRNDILSANLFPPECRSLLRLYPLDNPSQKDHPHASKISNLYPLQNMLTVLLLQEEPCAAKHVLDLRYGPAARSMVSAAQGMLPRYHALALAVPTVPTAPTFRCTDTNLPQSRSLSPERHSGGFTPHYRNSNSARFTTTKPANFNPTESDTTAETG